MKSTMLVLDKKPLIPEPWGFYCGVEPPNEIKQAYREARIYYERYVTMLASNLLGNKKTRTREHKVKAIIVNDLPQVKEILPSHEAKERRK